MRPYLALCVLRYSFGHRVNAIVWLRSRIACVSLLKLQERVPVPPLVLTVVVRAATSVYHVLLVVFRPPGHRCFRVLRHWISRDGRLWPD